MKKIAGLIVLAVVLVMSGCGYKSGVATGERQSFLYFTGEVKGAEVSVDDGARFTVEPGRDNQYRVAPGKHNVKVYSGDTLVVDRDIYLGDGVAKEIGVRQ